VITAFTRDDVHDIFEMRKILEGEAARRAAAHIDKATLASLRATAEDLKGKPDGAEFLARWATYNDVFHDTIAKSAASVRLWHDIMRYRMLHRGFNMLKTSNENLLIALAEHLQVLDALDRGDGDAACKLMQQHIGRWQSHFVNQVPVRA
jgi:DNA-binding GntR family transcriptional regulator